MAQHIDTTIDSLVRQRILIPTASRLVYICVCGAIRVLKNELHSHLTSDHHQQWIASLAEPSAHDETQQILHGIGDEEETIGSDRELEEFIRPYPYLQPVEASVCNVCTEINVEFVRCKNGHATCVNCHHSWLKTKSDEGKVMTCAFCRAVIQMTKQDNLTILMHRIREVRNELIETSRIHHEVLEELEYLKIQENMLMMEYNHIFRN